MAQLPVAIGYQPVSESVAPRKQLVVTDIPAIDIARFFGHVRFVKNYGCWEWTGAKTNKAGGGYGTFQDDCAHRHVYRWFVGPIPDGFEIDHLCENRACVNPDHLEAVTPAVNRARAKEAAVRRCKNGHLLHPINIKVHVERGKQTVRCATCGRLKFQAYRDRRRSHAAA